MECRLASISDKQEVIEAFPGIYEGWDFVPNGYQDLAENPKTTLFVGEIHEKIVSTHLRLV